MCLANHYIRWMSLSYSKVISFRNDSWVSFSLFRNNAIKGHFVMIWCILYSYLNLFIRNNVCIYNMPLLLKLIPLIQFEYPDKINPFKHLYKQTSKFTYFQLCSQHLCWKLSWLRLMEVVNKQYSLNKFYAFFFFVKKLSVSAEEIPQSTGV